MKSARRLTLLLQLGLAMAPAAIGQQPAPATPPTAPAPPSAAPKPANTGWIAANPAVDCAGVKDRLLCADLLSMRDRDQFARREGMAHPNDKEAAAATLQIDQDNQRRLDAIIREHGWPTVALVGRKASASAWTVTQHADLPYQKKYLDQMTAAANGGELSWALLATSIDRIRVREGKPQVYGSQFHEVNGQLVPQPIEDEAHVDERRAKVGMQPLAEYKRLMEEFFMPKPAPAPAPQP